MTRWLAIGVTALAACLAASHGHADTSTLARAGSWEAFGGTTKSGRPVCGVSAEPASRYFGLKLFSGDSTFTIQIGTKEWRLEDGRKIALTMTLDANSPWNAGATAFHFSDGDAGLEFTVKKAELETFLREFRSSSQMRIHFKDGGLRDWLLGLEGTNTVNNALQECIRKLR
jgi:hypothetical protein